VPAPSGWDAYADFYDWENARTLGRQDVPFWRRLVADHPGRALELGCGTGRLLAPLARAGADVTGIDLSAPMLARARTRLRRLPAASRPSILRGDIRHLPFLRASFDVVLATYGMLQSLLSDADLDAALAEANRVLHRGGLIAIDLVPDLPAWSEYHRQVRLRGPMAGGGTVTLVETARQDRRRGVTMFDEEFVERRAGRTRSRRFSLAFRTVPLPALVDRLDRAGFCVLSTAGSYDGAPLDVGSTVWLVLAGKRRAAC
jgi:ubiquinone/menaquinone biosynthesis C-methylase UbiE